MSVKPEYHPHTHYWFQLNFGVEKPPYWFNRKREFITDISNLHHIRQSIYYEGVAPELFHKLRYEIYRKFKVSYHQIDICLGVCLTDLSNPYGVLYDWLQGAEPRIQRTKR